MPTRALKSTTAAPRLRGNGSGRVIQTAEDELRRFQPYGDRHMRVAPPPLPPSDGIEDLIRERDQEAAERKRAESDRAKREYRDYLISTGRDPAEFMDDEPPVDPARPRPRARVSLHDATAQVENEQARIERLEDEARKAAEEIRRSAGSIDRESQLLVNTEPPPVKHPFTARACTVADIDRMWDWIRGDNDNAFRFLGYKIQSSVQLHQLMTAIAKGENDRASFLRSLYLEGAAGHPHIGFGVLLPVMIPEKLAGTHLYLRRDMRGTLPQMMPALLGLAHDIMPGIKLALMEAHPAWQTLLEPHGFRMHTIFVETK